MTPNPISDPAALLPVSWEKPSPSAHRLIGRSWADAELLRLATTKSTSALEREFIRNSSGDTLYDGIGESERPDRTGVVNICEGQRSISSFVICGATARAVAPALHFECRYCMGDQF